MLVYNATNDSSTFRIRGLDNKPLREVRYSGGVWSWGKDWIYRDGSLLATVAPGADGLRYAHADHLGSPRLFTDASGLAREKYHYYPFGEQAGSAPATPEAMRFTGHERDPAASAGTTDELDYMHARYCNPQLGRFLGVDPENGKPENPQSWNRYAYAVNSHLETSAKTSREHPERFPRLPRAPRFPARICPEVPKNGNRRERPSVRRLVGGKGPLEESP